MVGGTERCANTTSINRASAALRVSHPGAIKSVTARNPYSSCQSTDEGFSPTNPVNAVGISIEPPTSDPAATVDSPPVTDVAAPQLEPPKIR